MTKRIFYAICLTAISVLLAALVLVVGVLNSHFTRVQMDQLRAETALVAHALENEGGSYFQRLENTVDCRITWIGADGEVLYDNRSDSRSMETHLQREEVVNAFAQGYGESIRRSDTLMERYLYGAKLLSDGTVLRLAVSQNSIRALLLDMMQPIAVVMVIAVVLSLLIASQISRGIVKPLNELNLNAPLANREYEEILPLLHRLDLQQNQLRHQAGEFARQKREFDAVTRSLAEGMVLMSQDGTILSINPAAARLLDVTPNCAGANFAVANRNGEIGLLVKNALTGEKAEQTIALQGGTFLAVASPVKTQDKVTGAALLLLDVTEKRRSEALRREFAANVSHELKTPLHTISGYAELMQGGMVSAEDIPAFAGIIYKQARHMTRLVEDILHLSHLDEGGKDLQWGESDLYALAQQMVLSLSAAAELAEVALEVQGEPAVLRSVPQLLTGILFNLTDNAIKYNRPGGTVTLKVENTASGPRLTVSDTGIGIPAEDRERIFERFYRVDKSHSRALGGTGLGLSIVKHAALIHGAEIQLDSTVGKGTVVTVQFPGK